MARGSLSISALALLGSLFFSAVSAQLSTSCNPLNATCPADPALGTTHSFNFNATPPTGTWNVTAGTINYSSDKGAAFTINKKGDSPTIMSNFYFFWGRTETIMQAAPGQGIISSIVWSSDDLDEVDWEFLGGNASYAETNYFGKGRQNFTNAIYHPAAVQDGYHNYTTIWTNTSLQWWIDGKLVRTLLPKDANNTNDFPQTPMKMSLGIWAGGDPDEPAGTIEWAGGKTDYTKGPYTMYVKSVTISDGSTGSQYTYGDRSGSWQSIKVATGNSSALNAINNPDTSSSQSISDKWNALPSGAKAGVYAGAAGVGAIAIFSLLFYYIRQRKRGRAEAAAAAAKEEQDRLEMERFKKEGINPDELRYDGEDYDPAVMGKEAMVNTTSYNLPPSRGSAMSGEPEKPWDATAAAPISPLHGNRSPGYNSPVNNGPRSPGADAMRSPMPLLRDGNQNPRMGSPGPGFNGPRNDGFSPVRTQSPSMSPQFPPPGSPSRLRNDGFSPVRTQSPGMPPQFPPPASPGPGPRSFSSPNPNMRMGSPGPQNGGYGAPRMQSPAPSQSRSPGPMMGPGQGPQRSYSAPRGPPPGGDRGYGGGYGGNGGYNGANDGYWNNGGYR